MFYTSQHSPYANEISRLFEKKSCVKGPIFKKAVYFLIFQDWFLIGIKMTAS